MTRRSAGSFALLAAVVASCLLAQAVASSASAPAGGRALLLQRFRADEVRGQCGFAQETFRTPMGVWSAPAYLNTDSRPGGCLQSFALVDPGRDLSGWSISIDFESDGSNDGCDHRGSRDVPVNNDEDAVTWTSPYRIDTDERDGGCTLDFVVRGRTDLSFDVDVEAEGVADQCPDQGIQSSTVGHPVRIRLKTDDRIGGCYLRFRLDHVRHLSAP